MRCRRPPLWPSLALSRAAVHARSCLSLRRRFPRRLDASSLSRACTRLTLTLALGLAWSPAQFTHRRASLFASSPSTTPSSGCNRSGGCLLFDAPPVLLVPPGRGGLPFVVLAMPSAIVAPALPRHARPRCLRCRASGLKCGLYEKFSEILCPDSTAGMYIRTCDSRGHLCATPHYVQVGADPTHHTEKAQVSANAKSSRRVNNRRRPPS